MPEMCEQCGKNPATVRFVIVVNGEKKEKMLCQECALKMQNQLPNLKPADLAGLLGNIVAKNVATRAAEAAAAKLAALPPKDESYNDLSCLACGTTYEQFQSTGMLGCAQCYQAFRTPIEVMLKRMTGNLQHVGKTPSGLPTALSRKLLLDKLRRQLTEAIENEEYEEAAVLRDKIRQMTVQNTPEVQQYD